MNVRKSIRCQLILTSLLVVAVLLPVQAQQDWHASVGGQSADMSKQAVAFLPNEIWIHAGEVHVVCGAATALHVTHVKLEGRKQISAKEFANGARLQPGEGFKKP